MLHMSVRVHNKVVDRYGFKYKVSVYQVFTSVHDLGQGALHACNISALHLTMQRPPVRCRSCGLSLLQTADVPCNTAWSGLLELQMLLQLSGRALCVDVRGAHILHSD